MIKNATCWPKALLLACLPTLAGASELPPRLLLVISKTDHTLQMRDADTFALMRTAALGPDPHEVTVSPDGRTAYVSNPGYGAFHRIDEIDLDTGQAKSPINTAPLMGPHGLVFAQDRLWFTAQGSKAIAHLDPKTHVIDWTMGTGQDTTHLLHVSTGGQHAYASNSGSGTISLFARQQVPPTIPPTGVLPAGAQPRMDWVHTVVPTGPGTEGMDVSPDERELWTVGPDGTLYVVDIAAKRVVAKLVSDLDGAHRLAFTPDGRQVMVVSVKTGALVVFDAATRKPVKRLQTGRGAGIYMDGAGHRAFVSCTPDGFVAVIDLATLTETARIEIARPDGVALVNRGT
ncbi:cytochrome D1 domain-containing protein [Stenotrophomonas sp.]|uniref:YncE family protein n=1 Tax=Stenotrophomonas sp. TaxID=69392 RepID=UPI0028A97D75|nr:cytochrome D1 domain-containing protein [Stenotrophomonas sp.]